MRSPTLRTAMRRCCAVRQSRPFLFPALAIACWMCGGASLAHADDAEVQFRTVWSGAERAADTAPRLEASVKHLGERPPATLELVVDGKPAGIGAVTRFADSNEPVAVAVVFEGQEVWFGPPSTDDNCDFACAGNGGHGMALVMEHAFPEAALPAGSQLAVIDYDIGAHLLAPMTAVARVAPAVLGSAKDHYRRIGIDLVQGVALGLQQLEASNAPHKLLIVIGDGDDTNNELAKVQLADLHKQALRDGIAISAVIYKAEGSGQGDVVHVLEPHAINVNSSDGINAAVVGALARFTDRVTAMFPGAALPWDGAPHVVAIADRGVVLASDAYQLAKWIRPSRGWWHQPAGYLVQLGAGALLAALYLAGLAMRTRWVSGRS